MGGHPLQGLDRPCYRYTIRTGNREVIESAILSRAGVVARCGSPDGRVELTCPKGNALLPAQQPLPCKLGGIPELFPQQRLRGEIRERGLPTGLAGEVRPRDWTP